MSQVETSSQPPAADDPRARLGLAMRRASALGVLHGQAVARRAGLSPSDLECLDLILMGGPATAGQIAARTGLTSGAVTGLIDRLERGGFVERRPDAGDRRKVVVHVRPERAAAVQSLFAPMERAFDALVAEQDDAFLLRLAGFLERAQALTMERIEALARDGP